MTRLTGILVALVAAAGCSDTLVDHNAPRALRYAALECRSGERTCGGGCYPAGTFTCGDGDACKVCQIPAGAIGHCTTAGDCTFECPGNTRLCGNACVAESATSCGACDHACPAPTAGTGVAVCTTALGAPPGQGQCGIDCGGANLCGTACVDESPSSCGPSCADCTASHPFHASGVCTAAHSCDYTCDPGFLRCAGGCCQATEISAGFAHACAVTDAGGLVCWGANERGQLGVGTTTHSPVPVTVYASGSGVVHVASGYAHTCVVFANGQVACWGDNTTAEIGGTAAFVSSPVVIALPKPARWAAAGGGGPSITGHTCVVHTDDTVSCWGNNQDAQLGSGPTAPSGPVGVTGLTVRAGDGMLAAGESHTCAVTPTGAVVCFGANDKMQDGDVTGALLHATPFQVPGVAAASRVMAGSQHTCAIEAAGGGGSPTTVAVCWGANGAGQVDAGNATATPKGPTLVTSGTFGSLAPTTGTTGPDFTCLIGKEGTTKCFGDNNQGQLGTSPGCLSTPVAVCEPTMSNEVFKAVSGGFAFTCALFVSNGVACFGANDSGQLGDGTHTGRNTPGYVSGG